MFEEEELVVMNSAVPLLSWLECILYVASLLMCAHIDILNAGANSQQALLQKPVCDSRGHSCHSCFFF